MTPPLVSVVMRAHNSAAFIQCAMRSILNQTEPDLELIVVEDASSDATPDLVRQVAQSDPRVRFDRRRERDGVGPALNRGLALARSELVAIMDADDVAVPSRIAQQSAFLGQHADVGAVGGALRVIDVSGRVVGKVNYPTGGPELARMARHSSPLATPSVMLRRTIFLTAGGCRPVFTTCEDYDLWLRIAEQSSIANLPDVLLYYRIHAGQESLAKLEVQMLLMNWARKSARERQMGHADPLDDPKLDVPELARRWPFAGVNEQELLAAVSARANFLSHVGLPLVALRVLALAPRAPLRGAARAQVHVAYARAYLKAHKPVCAGRSVLQAIRADPPTVARITSRAFLAG